MPTTLITGRPGLKTSFIEENIGYDGTQLAPHWIYRRFGLLGNAVVAFVGPAQVPVAHMVDQTDVRRNAPIGSPLMLHFLGEWFIDSFDFGIALQQLFLRNLFELLNRERRVVERRGSDLYQGERKLSVSIATRSLTSVLMHTALNIDTEGTPVPTVGLRELGLEPRRLATDTLALFALDFASMATARCKVSGRSL